MNLPAEPADATDAVAIDKRRWITSVHEASHLAVAIALGGKAGSARIGVDGSGLARCGSDLAPRPHAVMSAAGAESAWLALEVSPPERQSIAIEKTGEPPPSPRPPDKQTADIHRDLEYATADARIVAEWAIFGLENEPEAWAERVMRVRSSALTLVLYNVPLILAVARRLYLNGRISADEVKALLTPPAPIASDETEPPAEPAITRGD